MSSNFKNFFFLTLIVFSVIAKHWMVFIIGFILAVFAFNLLIRNKWGFKGYFTSEWNILTNKYKHKQEFDFPKSLLFPKLKEVLEKSGFRLKYTDEKSGNIMALSSISWYSWGENIYIHLTESNGKTKVEFVSACLIQMYDWGKNRKNFNRFISEFENSLII